MTAGPRDDILTNTAYYRNGFINVFIAPSKLLLACERVYVDVYEGLCICENVCAEVWVSVCVCISCHQPIELLELDSEEDNNH